MTEMKWVCSNCGKLLTDDDLVVYRHGKVNVEGCPTCKGKGYLVGVITDDSTGSFRFTWTDDSGRLNDEIYVTTKGSDWLDFSDFISEVALNWSNVDTLLELESAESPSFRKKVEKLYADLEADAPWAGRDLDEEADRIACELLRGPYDQMGSMRIGDVIQVPEIRLTIQRVA